MDGGAWWAVVQGVAKSQTWLNDFTFTFHFHASEKEMATHSSVLAWRVPETGEPGVLPSMGSHSSSSRVKFLLENLRKNNLWTSAYDFIHFFPTTQFLSLLLSTFILKVIKLHLLIAHDSFDSFSVCGWLFCLKQNPDRPGFCIWVSKQGVELEIKGLCNWRWWI